MEQKEKTLVAKWINESSNGLFYIEYEHKRTKEFYCEYYKGNKKILELIEDEEIKITFLERIS